MASKPEIRPDTRYATQRSFMRGQIERLQFKLDAVLEALQNPGQADLRPRNERIVDATRGEIQNWQSQLDNIATKREPRNRKRNRTEL